MICRDSELHASSTHQADLIRLDLPDECPTHKTQSRSESCVPPSSHSMLRLYIHLCYQFVQNINVDLDCIILNLKKISN